MALSLIPRAQWGIIKERRSPSSGLRNKSISLNKKGPRHVDGKRRGAALHARLPPAYYYGPHGGRTSVDCADELIARDRLIKTPTHRQRDPNAERRKYYSAATDATRLAINGKKPSSFKSTRSIGRSIAKPRRDG